MGTSAKRILVSINKVLTIITSGLLVLFVAIPFIKKRGRLIRIPLAVNVIIITILLLIIAAYGGAFSKKSSNDSALITKVTGNA